MSYIPQWVQSCNICYTVTYTPLRTDLSSAQWGKLPIMTEHHDHDELAVRAATDQAAFTDLYNAYMDPIYRFVMKRVSHKETTEDIVSDIFRKVFLSLKRFDPSRASFRTWIYRIATTTIIDYYRSNANPSRRPIAELSEAESLADPSDSPHEEMLSEEQKVRVHACMEQLPEKYHSAVQLKYFSELSNQEIADVLQVSPNNVGVILHRALRKLETILSEQSLYEEVVS